jgi:Flp pilus assembly protein TadD
LRAEDHKRNDGREGAGEATLNDHFLNTQTDDLGPVCGVPPSQSGAEQLFSYNLKAMAKMAQGTSVIIATLLAIPDAFALLPNSSSLLGWLLRLIAVWLSALILWFAGYLSMMHLVAWASKGIVIGEDGIKLWRFGKLIPWAKIKAVGVEPQLIFSHIFSLSPPAQRLSLYVQAKPGAKLTPQTIPSFLFQPAEFQALLNAICQRSFAFQPDSQNVLIARHDELPKLKSLYLLLGWARIGLSLVISFGLITFLGRKATVNYFYNSGNRAFNQGELVEARRNYEFVTKIDPFFAVAWQNLGGTEFRLGDSQNACKHWHKALALKPDLVESKVSLAYIYIQERQFTKARNLLNHALNLAPQNLAALTNLADLDMRLGHTRDAMMTARLVLTIDQGNQLATGLIAQGRLRIGKPGEAIALLNAREQRGTIASELPFCRLIRGEAAADLGQLDQAEQYFQDVISENPSNPSALQDLARVYIRQKRWTEADDLMARASFLAPYDPWPHLIRSNLYLLKGDKQDASSYVSKAEQLSEQDALSLAESARIELALGNHARARKLAERSFRIEPVTPQALSIIQILSKEN